MPSIGWVSRPASNRWLSAYQSLQPSPMAPACSPPSTSPPPTMRLVMPWVYSCWMTARSLSPATHGAMNAPGMVSHRNMLVTPGIPSGGVLKLALSRLGGLAWMPAWTSPLHRVAADAATAEVVVLEVAGRLGEAVAVVLVVDTVVLVEEVRRGLGHVLLVAVGGTVGVAPVVDE